MKREDGGVDGFQFTVGRKHKCPRDSLGEFASKLGTREHPFRLYYVVPSTNFQSFITEPIKPVATSAEIYILGILPPPPSYESSTLVTAAASAASVRASASSDPVAKKK